MEEPTLSMVTDETEFEPVASNPGESEGKYYYYYCANTELHPNNEVIQIKTIEENPKCPYCGAVMTYGRYWGPLPATQLTSSNPGEPIGSKMRQGMRTWLKAECEDVGVNMLRALSGINYAYDAAYGLNVPGRAYSSEKYIEASLEEVTGYIATLPINLLTAEERREVFILKDEILEALKGKIPVKNVELKLLDLADLTKKYLLEKVVECQIGKSGG